MPDQELLILRDVFGRDVPFISNHKVVVCGGRAYSDIERVRGAFDFFLAPKDIVIHGGAQGADALAQKVAVEFRLQTVRVKPEWDRYGPSAGPRRNEMMARMKPRMLLAFPGGKGTADMISRAYKHGIPVIEISDGSNRRASR